MFKIKECEVKKMITIPELVETIKSLLNELIDIIKSIFSMGK